MAVLALLAAVAAVPAEDRFFPRAAAALEALEGRPRPRAGTPFEDLPRPRAGTPLAGLPRRAAAGFLAGVLERFDKVEGARRFSATLWEETEDFLAVLEDERTRFFGAALLAVVVVRFLVATALEPLRDADVTFLLRLWRLEEVVRFLVAAALDPLRDADVTFLLRVWRLEEVDRFLVAEALAPLRVADVDFLPEPEVDRFFPAPVRDRVATGDFLPAAGCLFFLSGRAEAAAEAG